MSPQVYVAELSQESHTFSPLPTALPDFDVRSGEEARGRYEGTNTVVGGFLSEARTRGWRVRVGPVAAAQPGGRVTREAYEALRDRLLSGLAAAPPPDGVLLSLHGAMVADGYDDPEADLLARLRQALGPRVPVAVVLDLHANVSSELVAAADILLGYNTYPHVDKAERGEEAAALLAAVLEGRLVPCRALVRLPALLVSMNMRAPGSGPMAEVMALAGDLERAPVVDVSVFGGFPYADVACAGAAVVATAHGDARAAADAARSAAAALWARRQAFRVRLPGPEEALDLALATGEAPVVLADVADNPDSGGTGDTTGLLRAALARGVTDAVASLIHDPETVARAHALGVGAEADFEVAGRLQPELGGPLPVRARVVRLGDGRFVNSGPKDRALLMEAGRVAVLAVSGGPGVASPPGAVELVVAERRLSTNDPALLHSVGIDPRARRLLLLKVKNHFRAAFEPLVARIIEVDAPGLATLDLGRLRYRRVPRPIDPLDEVTWEPRPVSFPTARS